MYEEIKIVLQYINNIVHIDKDYIEPLRTWLDANIEITYAISYYIRYHQFTNTVKRRFRMYIIDDYAFSHFLMLIDTLAKKIYPSINIEKSKERFTQIITDSMDDKNLKEILNLTKYVMVQYNLYLYVLYYLYIVKQF